MEVSAVNQRSHLLMTITTPADAFLTNTEQITYTLNCFDKCKQSGPRSLYCYCKSPWAWKTFKHFQKFYLLSHDRVNNEKILRLHFHFNNILEYSSCFFLNWFSTIAQPAPGSKSQFHFSTAPGHLMLIQLVSHSCASKKVVTTLAVWTCLTYHK